MKKILFFNLLAISILTVACTKHFGDIEQPREKVNLNFSAPTKGAVYERNDSILIKGIAIAPNTLHGYTLLIKKALDTTVYFTKQVHDHNDTLLINYKWKSELKAATDLEAQLIFAIDHEGTKFTKSVAFSVR